MALQNFVLDLIEGLLHDEALGLREEDLRFYDKGTTAETDETLDDHFRWRNARYYNEDSNVVRNSLLIVQLPVGESAEYINFHVGDLYRVYRKDGMAGVLPIVKRDIKDLRASAAGSLSLLNQFGDYEAIREHLIIRPLNYDDNEKALTRGVYRQVGDMALVLYISLGKVGQGGASNILSAMVPRDTFQGWALDEQEVLDRALGNTMRLQPPIFIDLAAMLGIGSHPRHVHVHPVGGWHKVSSMREILADTNRSPMNRNGELLSRQIYRYSRDTKEFTVI